MELLDALYFMPALVCLLWVISFILTEKTHQQKVLLICLIIAVPYFLAYGLWTTPNTNFQLYAKIERFSLPLALILVALMAIYMNIHALKNKVHIAHMLLLAPGIMYGTALNILYYIIGTDNAAKLYQIKDSGAALPAEFASRLYTTFYFIASTVMMYLAVISLIIVFSECIYVIYREKHRADGLNSHINNKQKPSPSTTIAICMMVTLLLIAPVTVSPIWVPNHPTIGISLAVALAIMLHLICITEYHSNAILTKPLSAIETEENNANENSEEKIIEKIMEEGDAADYISENSQIADTDNDDLDIDSIRVRRATSMFNGFAKLMIEEKIYLNPDLTVNDVAERLLVGRSTLSNMINHEYGKTFRSVLNDYRIYYAKQFMLDNPHCTQETIAIKCGFKDASAFSHKFKDIVGLSPLMWLTSQTKKENA